MKKIQFLLLLFPTLILPCILFGQSDQIKSAEDFVRGYFKLFEEKNIDAILKNYAEDGLYVSFIDSIIPLSELGPLIEKEWSQITYETIKIEWMKTKLMGPNTVLVTSKYYDIIDRSGVTYIVEIISNLFLEQKNEDWKIKMLINNHNFPLIYSDKVDKKYRVENPNLASKFSNLVNYSYSYQCNVVDYFKENKISPSETGKIFGKQYIKKIEESDGFDNLIKSYIDYLINSNIYVEIIEQTDKTFKARFLSRPISESWNISKDEMGKYSQNMWKQIAEKMGTSFTLTDDGHYTTVVMNKK